jgi:uncharacterized RDD family membrane protein YckC
MHCPKCQCEEISESGMCLWCGYQLTEQDSEPPPSPDTSNDSNGVSQADISPASNEPGREELPHWKQELSQRLRSIKEKREASRVQLQSKPAQERVTDFERALPEQPEMPAAEPSLPPRPRQEKIQQLESPVIPAPKPRNISEPEKADTGPLLKLIDLKESPAKAQDDFEDVLIQNSTAPTAPTHGAARIPPFERRDPVPDTGRMILVYRALSGLVDLLIMALCTTVLIVAADFFSGMKVAGPASFVLISVLFLLVYFVYSILFLGISNQTIGMMLMKLQLVSMSEKRPKMDRIVGRSIAYIVSFLCLGLGLLWALFDWDNRCLHDRLTKTRVIPVADLKKPNA